MTAPSPEVSLSQLADEFAASLDRRMRAALDDVPPISADTRTGSKPRISVAPRKNGDPEGLIVPIPLHVAGRHWLNLRVEMLCVWDRPNTFLTLDESSIRLEPLKERSEPLWRYEYERHQTGGLPAAHLHVHAHRDEATYLMARGESGRARQRAAKGGMATLSELHFVLGGHRFRPCLEDILEVVIVEFGVDSTRDGWKQALAEGRADWRRKQLAAAIRDSPVEAARSLERLNWTVTPPPDDGEGTTEDYSRMTAL